MKIKGQERRKTVKFFKNFMKFDYKSKKACIFLIPSMFHTVW